MNLVRRVVEVCRGLKGWCSYCEGDQFVVEKLCGKKKIQDYGISQGGRTEERQLGNTFSHDLGYVEDLDHNVAMSLCVALMLLSVVTQV